MIASATGSTSTRHGVLVDDRLAALLVDVAVAEVRLDRHRIGWGGARHHVEPPPASHVVRAHRRGGRATRAGRPGRAAVGASGPVTTGAVPVGRHVGQDRAVALETGAQPLDLQHRCTRLAHRVLAGVSDGVAAHERGAGQVVEQRVQQRRLAPARPARPPSSRRGSPSTPTCPRATAARRGRVALDRDQPVVVAVRELGAHARLAHDRRRAVGVGAQVATHGDLDRVAEDVTGADGVDRDGASDRPRAAGQQRGARRVQAVARVDRPRPDGAPRRWARRCARSCRTCRSVLPAARTT